MVEPYILILWESTVFAQTVYRGALWSEKYCSRPTSRSTQNESLLSSWIEKQRTCTVNEVANFTCLSSAVKFLCVLWLV